MALGTVNVGPSKNQTLDELGALSKIAEYTNNANTQLTVGASGENIITLIHRYDANTLNTPYKAGVSDFAAGDIITFAYSPNYSTQICIPVGSDVSFTRSINNGVVSAWVKSANENNSMKFMGWTDDLNEIIESGVFGWYDFNAATANTPMAEGFTEASEGVVLNIPDNGHGYAQQYAYFKGSMIPVYRYIDASSAISAWQHPYVPCTGCTMDGALVATPAQVAEDYTTAQVRNAVLVPAGGSIPAGENGDLCFTYNV